MEVLRLDGSSLVLDDVIRVARTDVQLKIEESALQRVSHSRRTLEGLLKSGEAIYGVNTGFGALSNARISDDELGELQVNLIRSHASSMGKPHPAEIVRAIMLLRANALLKGNSGVKPETVRLLVDLLNKRVHPVIPEKGSVGASGDLSPLSHMALVLMGEGQAEYKGQVLPGGQALDQAGSRHVVLEAKEGLALNNGTQQMTAIGCLALCDAFALLNTSLACLALSLQALNGWADPFDQRIHSLRRHSGQKRVADITRKLLAGSGMVQYSSQKKDNGSQRSKNPRPQDPYSFRCAPQVMGTADDLFEFAKRTLEIEINSVTDNPLVFSDSILSGGNFHGQPIAASLDVLALGLSTLGNISERRISALLDPSLNNGLPPFLVGRETHPGLASGLMALQYTAAALVAENKVLSHPASSDSIPTSANFEDHVSMGPGAAMKAQQVLENTQRIVAIEIITALQGVDSRERRALSAPTREVYELVREKVPYASKDISFHSAMEEVFGLVKSGPIGKIVQEFVDK